MTGVLPIANSAGDYSGYEDPSMFNGTEYWLRGGWYTDLNGMVEFTTVYPGFYWLRAPHIHVMVHKDLVQSENGFVHVMRSIPADPN